MRILIATGIFPPESGGPATYVVPLAQKLVEAGASVSVVTLSARAHEEGDATYSFKLTRIQRFPQRDLVGPSKGPTRSLWWGVGKLSNYIRFFLVLFKEAHTADIIYSLDWYSAGFLAALASLLRGKPFTLRIGGDYIWEQKYLEKGKPPMPLKDFYERGIYKKYPLSLFITRFILGRAERIAFNSDDQCSLYERFYNLLDTRLAVIRNPLPSISLSEKRGEPRHEFIFWGRLIVMKNVEALIRAFALAKLPADYTLAIIGDGPRKDALEKLIASLDLAGRARIEPAMPRAEVLARVKGARAFILPSWTDVSPNQVYEALALGLPALVTRENYLDIRERLPAMIDPHSPDDIAAHLEKLADDAYYEEFSARFCSISVAHDWNDALRDHEELFRAVLHGNLKGIRVLQLSADRSAQGVFNPESATAERQRAYAAYFGALDIIGFSRSSDGYEPYDLSPNTRIYPTRSFSRLLYGFDASAISRRLPKPDVVSAQDPFETGLAAWMIARLRGVPLHVQLHTDVFAPGFVRHAPMNRVRRMLARFVLKRAVRIRVVSMRVKEGIEREAAPKAPITVLPIFTDTERFRHAAVHPELFARFQRFSLRMLVVSRLEKEKNVALALRTFAQAAPKEACLIILGSGSVREALERLAHTLSIADRVFFEGAHDSAPYYALADLVLVTSRYEGYGLVIIEALAAGKPVLSTDVGIGREAGAIVADEAEFPEALAQWCKDGPREAVLREYPYENFDTYARAYCADIAACVKK